MDEITQNVKMRVGRYTVLILCVLFLAWNLYALFTWPERRLLAILGTALGGFLTVLGISDLIQQRHAVLRNYPVIGHVRWLVEMIRPEIRQYLLEDDKVETPFSRAQRSLVYRRAKAISSEHPFGTLEDLYAPEYGFIQHSMQPADRPDPKSYRITIGNDQCAQPYSASVFNISAMSFGSLSANAIRALNKGAALGGFYHDTGEGSVSPYHLEGGGDIVWEVASGYFGCRKDDGTFDPDKFAAQAADPRIRMIEIKLSQGAKPGHGGILPGKKVTPEIAATRGVPVGVDCVSPARHSAFSTPLELMAFITELRRLSGGKPVGFKLCLGLPWEFMAIVKAMLQTGVTPDFIVVDGGEGGTGAAPVEFSDHIGTPMREGLLLVHNCLVGVGLRDKIKIGVAGKIISAYDMVQVLAVGADWCNSARGFMFALGCIQSMSCNTNRCPTGVATQDKVRQAALDVGDKSARVANFHDRTVEALADMLAAAGLKHPDDLKAHHLVHRVGTTELRGFDRVHLFLEPGQLIEERDLPVTYAQNWAKAQAESFNPRDIPATNPQSRSADQHSPDTGTGKPQPVLPAKA